MTNISKTQFTGVINNLLAHENDEYNLYNNNCTSLALNAFNTLITPQLVIEPFYVQIPGTTNLLVFMQSPQKLYKAIETITPGTGIIKEFQVVNDAPFNDQICQ
ncbi:MAG: hypothetical protein IPL97_12990 [Niastella sp.]|nr:hypothetical protein [Niastella sp.]